MDSGRMIKVAAVAITAGAATIAMGGVALNGDGGDRSARVRVHDAAGEHVGDVRFSERRGETTVRVDLQLDPSQVATDVYHGFHIHANDDPANGTGCIADPAAAASTWFTSADGHWKTGAQGHGAHLGDLFSLYVTSGGSVEGRFVTNRFRVADLAGRAVVIHAGPDNFGNVPVGAAANQYTPNSAEATTATANTGNAGARIACGVVGR